MSFTRLRYHIVTATKDRVPFITPELEAVIFPPMHCKAKDEGGRILRIGGVEDHVHLIVALRPTVAPADFVRAVKARGSRAATQSGLLPEPFRWQRGYAAFTLDARDVSDAMRYVARQKEHHAAGTTRAAFERLP